MTAQKEAKIRLGVQDQGTAIVLIEAGDLNLKLVVRCDGWSAQLKVNHHEMVSTTCVVPVEVAYIPYGPKSI